ncbi:unnamed protein product [Alopecurus aequalis]
MDRFQGPNSVWQLDRKNEDTTAVEYFALADLWDNYAESSAYGLAVPLRGAGGDVVTQHFVPYLSAVQLYTATRPITSLAVSRSIGSETDSWSDDSGVGGERFAGSWDAASEDDEDSAYGGAASSSKHRGYLNFQYREWDSPYDRVPLSHKVSELAQDYPCLTSLRSAELSPSSWMSVAWYPIYHIPAHGHGNLKGISACFLTYHSISSVFQVVKKATAARPQSSRRLAWRHTRWKAICGGGQDPRTPRSFPSSTGRRRPG